MSDRAGTNEQRRCLIEHTIALIGGKWKIAIMWQLVDGPKRFGELQRSIAGITHKMLTQQLRELEGDGLVTRTVHGVNPSPHVEYAFSPLGESLRSVLLYLDEWGRVHLAA